MLLVQPVAGVARVERAQLATEDHVSAHARAVDVDDVAAHRRASLRSMLMIGVTPLPALMNNSRSR